MKISATIITLNEERNIARAMESLRCCDEIVVVDSGSRIGRRRSLQSSARGWSTACGRVTRSRKNYGGEQAANDWILSIDADEALSEALEGEIWQIKKSGPQFDAYTMPRMAQYLGKWILHSGWYPDRKVRLYNRSKSQWVGEYRARERALLPEPLGTSNRISCTSPAIRFRSI